MSELARVPLLRFAQQLRTHGEAFSSDFFIRLFSQSPDLRDLFPSNVTNHQQLFSQVLIHIYQSLASDFDHTEILNFLRQLSADHRKYAVQPEHYEKFGIALREQIIQTFGDEFSAKEYKAINHNVELIIGVMRGAAQSLPPENLWEATVTHKIVIARDLAIVRLRSEHSLLYRAGQFIETKIPQWPHAWRNFSPAIPPNSHGDIEFHIRAIESGTVSKSVVNSTEPGDIWKFAAHHGNLQLNPRRPALLIAGGTGLAPLRALLLHNVSFVEHEPVHLFFGVNYPGALYDLALLNNLSRTTPWLTITLVVASQDNPWWITDEPETQFLTVETGNLIEIVLAIGKSKTFRWDNHQILLAGSPTMIANSKSKLLDSGVDPEEITSDPVF